MAANQEAAVKVSKVGVEIPGKTKILSEPGGGEAACLGRFFKKISINLSNSKFLATLSMNNNVQFQKWLHVGCTVTLLVLRDVAVLDFQRFLGRVQL